MLPIQDSNMYDMLQCCLQVNSILSKYRWRFGIFKQQGEHGSYCWCYHFITLFVGMVSWLGNISSIIRTIKHYLTNMFLSGIKGKSWKYPEKDGNDHSNYCILLYLYNFLVPLCCKICNTNGLVLAQQCILAIWKQYYLIL